MKTALKAIGETRQYLVAINGGLFMVAYYSGDLHTQTCSQGEFIKMIERGIVEVENVAEIGHNFEIKFRGGLELKDFSDYSNNIVCLAEIEKDNTTDYVVMNRIGAYNILDQQRFKQLVARSLVDNYTISEGGVVRRMPNQRVTQLQAVEDCDTHWGMTGKELEALLKSKGFTLGYKSDTYQVYSDLYKSRSIYADYCWYDKNGAIIWYSQYYGTDGSRNTEGDPFYCGCKLYIDGVMNCTMGEASRLGVTDLGTISFSGTGHQRLSFDAREDLFQSYSKLFKVYTPNNPWDFKSTPVNIATCFNELGSKKDTEELRSIAFRISGVPEERKNSSMCFYGLYMLIASHRTIAKFTGKLKDIFAGFEQCYDKALKEEICSEILFRHATIEQVESFLKSAGVVIDTSVSVLAKNAKAKLEENKRKQMEEHKEKSLEEALEERAKRKAKMKEASKGILSMFNTFDRK